MQTKLTNIKTGTVIELDDELYPIDEFNWSSIVSTTRYALDGSLIIQQGKRKAGKPITLQSKPDMGLLTRQTLNELKGQSEIIEAEFWLEYRTNETVERVKVSFDHRDAPISADPVKEFISPRLDDLFIVTLKFISV